MSRTVKQIVASKVFETIRNSDLTNTQKEKLIDEIVEALSSRATNEKVKGDLVYDAYLNDYIKKEHMTTKKVKLKSGEVVERYNSMSKASRKLKLEMAKLEEANQVKIVNFALGDDAKAKEKIIKLKETLEKTIKNRKAKLIKELNK